MKSSKARCLPKNLSKRLSTLSEILPEGVAFAAVNKVMNKKALAQLIDTCYRSAGVKATNILADKLKDTGYH